jgi:putative spermidine/putrescine transport system substrate-binding protein
VSGKIMSKSMTRRLFVRTAAGVAACAGGASKSWAQAAPAMPKAPIALNVIDVAGNLALTQPVIENYRKANPAIVSRVNFVKATQPELPSKIKAQQDAGRVDIDLVLCGYDGMTGGIPENLWLPLLPAYAGILPKPEDVYTDGALKIQAQAKGQGLCVVYSPYGPLLEYMPDRVKVVPSTADEVLAWARENKNRFMYSRPANSGPARAFMAGLPFILGDADPRDPSKGWDKTWSYLKALGEHIEYYPATTGATMKEFGEGSRDLIPVSLGFDIYPRAIGIVPKEAKTSAIKGFHWVTDGHFMCVPKGIPDDRLAVTLDLMKFMLAPAQQAYVFGQGSTYPGPAVKGVTIDTAPEASRQVFAEFGRPEYAELMANNPQELPLTPEATVTAFRIWDETVGGAKKK